jgi:hypothetical protein
MKKTMLVKVVRTDNGYEIETDGGVGDYSCPRKSRQECYRDCEALWPANSTWVGHKVHGGYRITIN